MSETPKQAARRLSKQWVAKGYKPRALHEYRNADGSAIYWRVRLEHPEGDAAPGGRKIIRPMQLNGSGYTLGEPDFPGGKPLYNLDLLAANPTARVWIVEGEKAADALTKLGAVAATSGGADSADRADWSPLRGRECYLWRDNDVAGTAYAGNVAATLVGLGCRLTAVDVDQLGLPPKGDACDWLQAHENATLADLNALPMLTPAVSSADATAAGKTASATVAQVLIETGARCDLFHDDRGDGYAVTADRGIARTLRLRGRDFRRWICGRCYAETGKAANGEAIAAALGVLEAKATFDGRRITLFNRFAEQDGDVFIDLCDEKWRAVKVTAEGWVVLEKPPILFRRYAHQQALPEPEKGGDLAALRPFLNLRNQDEGI